jgi:hypothetical protein
MPDDSKHPKATLQLMAPSVALGLLLVLTSGAARQSIQPVCVYHQMAKDVLTPTAMIVYTY